MVPLRVAKRTATPTIGLVGVLVVVSGTLAALLLGFPKTESEALVDLKRAPSADGMRARGGVGSGPVAAGPERAALEGSTRSSLGGSLEGEVVDAGATEVAPRNSFEELQEFRSFAAEALREVRHEKAESLRTQIERRRRGLEGTVSRRSQLLELSPQQSTLLHTALLRQLDRDAEYVRLWESGSDEDYLAELKEGDRKRYEAELAEFLTAGQLRRAKTLP